MTTHQDRKLYLGPRLRVLRRELGLNQAQMAQELGVSPSYLNHLERNQRPLTAQMLLRLANTYEIDVRDFVAGAAQAEAGDLQSVFADGLVRDIGIARNEVMEVAENYPGVSEAIMRLYRALTDLREAPGRVEELTVRPVSASNAVQWLRDMLQARRYHLSDIDDAAEALAADLGAGPEAMRPAMRAMLADRYGIRVQVVEDGVLVDALWHYDFHRRRLMLSERMDEQSRQFAVAVRLAESAFADRIRAEVDRAGAPDDETRMLLRRALVSYAAAAIVMPYARFLQVAQDSQYDMELLKARFGVSYEQAAQRLVTLTRAAARGVPMFMMKIDWAGAVSKRCTSDGAWVARAGGGCARWGVQRAFRQPGEPVTALVEAPDGERFVTVARAIPPRPGRAPSMIILGCPDRHAGQISGLTRMSAPPVDAIPIGPRCHLCERAGCPDRALPPVTRVLDLSDYARPASPYPFRAI